MLMLVGYEDFRWDTAVASDWRWPAGGVCIYLAVVFALGYWAWCFFELRGYRAELSTARSAYGRCHVMNDCGTAFFFVAKGRFRQ